jgi:hypothetical protein
MKPIIELLIYKYFSLYVILLLRKIISLILLLLTPLPLWMILIWESLFYLREMV